jgi:signal transduction histidine kinase
VGWNRGYLIVVALTLGALLLLAGLSFQALQMQGSEESERELQAAQARVIHAAQSFFDELFRRRNEFKGIVLSEKKIGLPSFYIPDSPEAREAFLQIALASSTRRLALLDGFLNAGEGEKCFWAFLLFHGSRVAGDVAQVKRDLERLLRISQDFRWQNGFSLKTHATLQAAELFRMKGAQSEVRSWLLRLAELPRPEILPEMVRDFWPGTEERDAAVFVHWVWKNSIGELPAAGWHFHEEEPILVFAIPEGRQVVPGADFFRHLLETSRQAVGGRADLAVQAVPGSGSFPLPLAVGRWFHLAPAQAEMASRRGMLRVLIGSILAVVLLGFAFIVLQGMRQVQEERSFRRQEVFFRQAAHDLKTPLTTMRALAETLAMGRIRSEEQGQKYLEAIVSEVDRSSELVDTMLMTARLKGRLIEPRVERISPEAILRRLLVRLQPRLEGWQVVFSCPPTLEVCADPEMWERAAVNLIENVLRHAASGKDLTVSAAETPRGIELTVEDRGSGRAVDVARAIQAGALDSGNVQRDTSPPDGGGATRQGFGLFLVRMILELHGGTLGFSERQGGGMRFSALWPDHMKEGTAGLVHGQARSS